MVSDDIHPKVAPVLLNRRIGTFVVRVNAKGSLFIHIRIAIPLLEICTEWVRHSTYRMVTKTGYADTY